MNVSSLGKGVQDVAQSVHANSKDSAVRANQSHVYETGIRFNRHDLGVGITSQSDQSSKSWFETQSAVYNGLSPTTALPRIHSMLYQRSSIQILAAIAAFSIICPSPVSAQLGGETGNTGQTETGNQDGNSGTVDNNQTDAGATAGGLNAEDAFSGVERGNAIGSTDQTGLGFSDVGVGGGGLGGGLGGFGGGGFGGGLGGLSGGQNFGGQSQSTQPVIRTRLRSAIEGPSPTPQAVGQKLSYQMRSVPQSAGLRGVNVSVNGTTAIVTGVVSTDKQRRMTELLMRLEPGVRHVENRITVAP